MAQLPLNLSLEETQKRWKSQLDPVLANAIFQGQQLPSQALKVGDNVINHKLGRMMQGWFIVDVDNASTIYRSQPLNATLLTLNASAACNVSIWVY